MHQYSFLFFLKFFLGEVKIKDAISMDYKQLTMLDNDLWPWKPFSAGYFPKCVYRLSRRMSETFLKETEIT